MDSFDICVQWKNWLISQFGWNKPALHQLGDPAWHMWEVEGGERFVKEFTTNEKMFDMFDDPKALLVFLCRNITYQFRSSPYISVYDTPKENDTLSFYTNLLGAYIRQERDVGHIQRQLISCMKKNYKHLKNNTRYKTKTASMKKLLANKKRTIRSKINFIVTEKRMKANVHDKVYDTIKTPIDFVQKIAEAALCAQLSVDSKVLPTWRLFDFVAQNNGIFFDSLVKNATIDLLHTLSNMIDHINSTLYIKLILVNPPTCTCHVKCKGFKTRNLADIFDKTVLQSISGLTRCKLCRFSPNVYNTSAKKPRRNICHQNIASPVCSLHDTPTLERVPIYRAWIDKSGAYYYKHIFYVTNSSNIQATMMGEKKSGPKYRLYGLCYGGSRTCYNKVVVYKSKDENDNLLSRPYSDCVKRSLYGDFMCTECHPKRIKCDEFLISNGFEDFTTCLADMFNKITPLNHTKIDLFIRNMCDGCRMKILCPHIVKNIRTYARSVGTALKVKHYRRLVIIQYIQEIIKKNLQ